MEKADKDHTTGVAKQTHKLAVIMFTDIVGYTALMDKDEDKAFAVLRKSMKIQRSVVEKYSGSWLKEIGDGVLISFGSTSKAVACAREIMSAVNKEPELDLRIGLHLGEVMLKDGDVFGSGVNIASRIQELAPPNGIWISESVYRDIANKKAFSVDFVGEKKLKHVQEPIKLYELNVEGRDRTLVSGSKSKGINRKWVFTVLGVVIPLLVAYFIYQTQDRNVVVTDLEIEKSIAVLPFKNMSADGENQYFADGIMEDILTKLQRMENLVVRPRTSVEPFRQTDKTASEIGAELGVGYLLRGSARKAEDQVMISAQLIHASEDRQIWADNFTSEYSTVGLFNIQSNIAGKIVEELRVKISPENIAQMTQAPTENLIAYDYYLKGLDYFHRGEGDHGLRYAIGMFERAVKLDSSFTLAWLGLASSSRQLYWNHFVRSEDHVRKTKHFLDQAIALDPNLLEVQLEIGRYYYHCEMDYDKALEILEPLKSEYPNNDQIFLYAGAVYRRMGHFEKSLEYMEQAILLNPSHWPYWVNAALSLRLLGRYSQVEEYYKTALNIRPSGLGLIDGLVNTYLTIGETDKAGILLTENQYLDLPDIDYNRSLVEFIIRNYQEANDILISSPHEIREDQFGYTPKSLQLGLNYLVMTNKDSADKYFEKAIEELIDKSNELPEDSRLHSSLGLAYAGLGRNERALNSGRKALSIIDISIDAVRGFYRQLDMAKILLMLGEKEKAVEKLDYLIQQNGLLTVELLKIDPFWDPLRNLDSFKVLVNNPKYQIKYVK